jgi:hypothetical protein
MEGCALIVCGVVLKKGLQMIQLLRNHLFKLSALLLTVGICVRGSRCGGKCVEAVEGLEEICQNFF